MLVAWADSKSVEFSCKGDQRYLRLIVDNVEKIYNAN